MASFRRGVFTLNLPLEAEALLPAPSCHDTSNSPRGATSNKEKSGYADSMATYGVIIDRVDGVTPLLGDRERPLAERVVAICRVLDVRPRNEGRLTPDAGDTQLKRELGSLTEQLGRRATVGLPAATLGRAALADLHADLASFHRVIADCEAKLALLGH